MKKCFYTIMVCLCSILLSACSNSKQVEELKSWDCTVTCAEGSYDSYVITYSNEKIVSSTGFLTIENRNDFDIVVHLLIDDEERTQEISAGGGAILYQIIKDTEYTVG